MRRRRENKEPREAAEVVAEEVVSEETEKKVTIMAVTDTNKKVAIDHTRIRQSSQERIAMIITQLVASRRQRQRRCH